MTETVQIDEYPYGTHTATVLHADGDWVEVEFDDEPGETYLRRPEDITP